MRKDTANLLVNPAAAFIGLSVLLLICQYSQLAYTSIKSVLSGFELVVFESRKMLLIPKKRIPSVLLVIRASTSFSVMFLSLFFIFLLLFLFLPLYLFIIFLHFSSSFHFHFPHHPCLSFWSSFTLFIVLSSLWSQETLLRPFGTLSLLQWVIWRGHWAISLFIVAVIWFHFASHFGIHFRVQFLVLLKFPSQSTRYFDYLSTCLPL